MPREPRCNAVKARLRSAASPRAADGAGRIPPHEVTTLANRARAARKQSTNAQPSANDKPSALAVSVEQFIEHVDAYAEYNRIACMLSCDLRVTTRPKYERRAMDYALDGVIGQSNDAARKARALGQTLARGLEAAGSDGAAEVLGMLNRIRSGFSATAIAQFWADAKARLQLVASNLRKGPRKPASGGDCIVALGKGRYRVGDVEYKVGGNENKVLSAFIGCPTHDVESLGDGSNCGFDQARKAMANLIKKYDGTFAPFIERRGRNGGYHVKIRAAAKAPTQRL